MAPTDSGGSGGGAIEDKELSKEDMINFMADDNDENEVIELEDKKSSNKKEAKTEVKVDEKDDEKDDSEEEKEEVDELDEIEEELKKDETNDEEEIELISPLKRREVLAKYPNIFKEFPQLEKAYYKEQKYSELLPTIKDAKDAVEKAEVLDKFEIDLAKGNTEKVLLAVKQSSPDAFAKLVDDYLPNLAKVDQTAYHHVLGNVIKNTILAMAQEARDSNDEDLMTAASAVNKFVFASSKFEKPVPLSKGEVKNPEIDELKKKEQEFTKRQFETARDSVSDKIDKTLKATIEGNIDPKESMTDYVRRNASREALEELQEHLNSDTRLKSILNKLWERAFKDNFSPKSVEAIKSTYLSRARTLLPSVIKKARNEALKGLGKRVKEDDEETTETTSLKKGPVASGKSTTSVNRGKSPRESAKTIPQNMSTLDFLMSDD
jgi:hypothetical protein